MTEEYRNALPAGAVIDTYQIKKILGVGGFGITYLVRELNLGKAYAIKELLPDGIAIRQGGETTVMARSTGDQESFAATRKYFISEAQVLAGMDHPAVVSVHRLMEANGTCYMVMDYVEGDTLGDHLKKRGGVLSSADEFKKIFYPLMSGLELLHGQGIIHRDIKPGNIMVQPDGSPVLLDFGAATQVQNKTMTITQMLSAGYSPFEQYTSRAKQEPYTDIYALGATMLKAITGEKPDDASDRMYDDHYQSLIENKTYVSTFGTPLLAAVDQALKMDAGQRPQCIEDWRTVMSGSGTGVKVSRDFLFIPPNASTVPAGKEKSPQGAERLKAPPVGQYKRHPKHKKKANVFLTGVIVSLVTLLIIGGMVWSLGGKGSEGGSTTKEKYLVEHNDEKAVKKETQRTSKKEPLPPQKDPRLHALVVAQGLVELGEPLPSDFFDKVDKNDLKSLAEDGNAQAQFLRGVEHDSTLGLLKADSVAVKWYRKAADQGHANAQYNLGWMYANGLGVSKDERQAVQWFQIAADKDFVLAQYQLGRCYADGTGVSKDEREAVKWYAKAADKQNAEAQYELGRCYLLGIGMPENKRSARQAAQWYRNAADQELAVAQYMFAVCLADGIGVSKDDWEAVKWYRKAADQENAEAQYRLGFMYASGRGVRKDEREAVKWYGKAANQGFALAQYVFAVCYADGRGIIKSEYKAVKWYRKAADQGHGKAQYYLGLMYANGKGVIKDEREAVTWYRKAAERALPKAQYHLGLMYADGRGVIKDERVAVDWYQKAARQGDVGAQNKLGAMYANGRGVSKDEREALKWFQKAAEQEDAQGQYEMGRCYLYGIGVPKDKAAAKVWLQKAYRNTDDRAQNAALKLWTDANK